MCDIKAQIKALARYAENDIGGRASRSAVTPGKGSTISKAEVGGTVAWKLETDFSSLIQIYCMPTNNMHSGKSFFMSAADHKRPAAASGITIVLGGSLAPEVVAREVVTEDTSHWLRSMGYKMLQKDFMYTPANAGNLHSAEQSIVLLFLHNRVELFPGRRRGLKH